MERVLLNLGILAIATIGIFGRVNAETTSLSPGSCILGVTAEAYNIDFGTFSASDVYGQTKTNQGTKTGGGNGILRTPTSGSGNEDYYIYASNPCIKVEWVVQVIASGMTGAIGGTPIPASALVFSGADLLFRFNDSPSNPQIINWPKDTNLATAQTVISHGGINNGIGGDYGVLLNHALIIPANTAVTQYTGTFTVTCLAC